MIAQKTASNQQISPVKLKSSHKKAPNAIKAAAARIFNRPHIIVPAEDNAWVREQKPSISRFWHECWEADPYGSRWMTLTTRLSASAFRLARHLLEATGLFKFRRIEYGCRRNFVWEVWNLHGARVRNFWRGSGDNSTPDELMHVDLLESTNDLLESTNDLPESTHTLETVTQQALEKPSVTYQEHLTNSSKELVRWDNSTSDEITGVAETAIASFGDASPQPLDEVELAEELIKDPAEVPHPFIEEEYKDVQPEPDLRHVEIPKIELDQVEVFKWLDRASSGECPPLSVIQNLLDGKYYSNAIALINQFGKLWNLRIVNYQIVNC